jgi:hypothetical protein
MESKPRVVKDYEKLETVIQEQIKLTYPYGFSEYLVSYLDREGKRRTALPFETDEKYYLVRMTESEAVAIIDEDDDFDSDGMLKEDIKEEYEDKYNDLDYINTEEGEEKDSYRDDPEDDNAEEDDDDDDDKD